MSLFGTQARFKTGDSGAPFWVLKIDNAITKMPLFETQARLKTGDFEG